MKLIVSNRINRIDRISTGKVYLRRKLVLSWNEEDMRRVIIIAIYSVLQLIRGISLVSELNIGIFWP